MAAPERYTYYSNIAATSFIRENENNPWLTRYLSEIELIQEKNFAMGVHEDRYILIAGGEDCDELLRFSSACMFDMKTHTFTTLADLPCFGPCVGAILNGWFYVYFKYFSLREFKPFYRLDLRNLSKRSKWSYIPNPDRDPALINGVVTDGNKLYVFGVVGDPIRDIFFCYDPETNESTKLPSMMKKNSNNSQSQRTRFAYAMVQDKVYVIGGMVDEKPTSLIHVFHLSTQSWTRNEVALPLPGPLVDAAATVFMKRWILVTGGKYGMDPTASDTKKFQYSTQTLILDTLTNEWSCNNFGITQESHGVAVVSTSHIVSIGSVVPRTNPNTPFDLFGNKRASIKTILRKYLLSNWDIVGYFIRMRYLLEKGRACSKCDSINCDDDHNYHDYDKNGKDSSHMGMNIIENVMTRLSIDMFKNVLSFLIHHS